MGSVSLRGRGCSFQCRRLRSWLSLLRSRLAYSRPPLPGSLSNTLPCRRTQLAFLRGSSLCHTRALRLTLSHSGPPLPLCDGNALTRSGAQNSLSWNRAICWRFWTPWTAVPELGLNPSDRLVDFGF